MLGKCLAVVVASTSATARCQRNRFGEGRIRLALRQFLWQAQKLGMTQDPYTVFPILTDSVVLDIPPSTRRRMILPQKPPLQATTPSRRTARNKHAIQSTQVAKTSSLVPQPMRTGKVSGRRKNLTRTRTIEVRDPAAMVTGTHRLFCVRRRKGVDMLVGRNLFRSVVSAVAASRRRFL